MPDPLPRPGRRLAFSLPFLPSLLRPLTPTTWPRNTRNTLLITPASRSSTPTSTGVFGTSSGARTLFSSTPMSTLTPQSKMQPHSDCLFNALFSSNTHTHTKEKKKKEEETVILFLLPKNQIDRLIKIDCSLFLTRFCF